MSSVSLPFPSGAKTVRIPALVKNISITLLENVITKGLSFLTILMLARSLGPTDYGQYSFVFVLVATASALFDLGMENTAVRFAAKDKALSKNVFGLYLAMKLALIAGVALSFLFYGHTLLGWMGKPAVYRFLPFMLLGFLGESLFLVNDTFLQASKKFGLRAAINISRYAIMLLYAAFLLKTGTLKLESIFFIYWIPVFFILLFLRQYVAFLSNLLKAGVAQSLLREIRDYQKWMCVYSFAYNLLGRVDFFMLSLWVGFQQLGIYNAAFQICSIFSFLPMAVGKVLLPSLSELSQGEIFTKTRKIIRATLLMILAAALLIPVLHFLLPVLFGQAYQASAPVLDILLVAFLFSFLSMPYEQALYSLGKPKILSIARYFQLMIIVLLNAAILPAIKPFWGLYAVALTALSGRIVYYAFLQIYYARCQREKSVPLVVREKGRAA